MSLSDSVGFPSSFPAHYKVIPEDKSKDEVETRLAKVGLDQDTFTVVLTQKMSTVQATIDAERELLNGKIQNFVVSNRELRLQSLTDKALSEEILSLRDQRITALEEQVGTAQQQMAKLIVKQTEETERLQKLLDEANKDKIAALVAAQAAWDQQRKALESQVKSESNRCSILQASFNTANSEKTALISAELKWEKQKIALESRVQSLQTNATNELPRQQAAIQTKIASLKHEIIEYLNRDISWCSNAKPCVIKNGHVYDATAALIDVRDWLSRKLA